MRGTDREHKTWSYGFISGLVVVGTAISIWAYKGLSEKADMRNEIAKREHAVAMIDNMLREEADEDKDGRLDWHEIQRAVVAAGYRGEMRRLESIIVYDPDQKRDFDGGMLHSRTDIYFQGSTAYVPVDKARKAIDVLRPHQE